MKLSPIEIRQQEFEKKMRGYDQDEVKSYLEKLADDIDEIQRENGALKEKLEKLESELTEFKKIEKNLQDTLLKAQESSTKSIESTKKQANLLLKEAELKSTQIIEKARENANEIRNAVINLREEKDLLLAKLKSMITSQAHLLEVKVESAGDEDVVISRKTEETKKLDIDISGIVDKL